MDGTTFFKGIGWILFIFLPGCGMVGPDFKSPAPAPVTRFTEKPLPAKTVKAPSPAGHTQTFVAARDIPADWWTIFHSAALNALVVKGIQGSPDLEAAQAALRVAWQNWRAGRGKMYPAISLSVGAQRQRFSSAEFGVPNSPATTFNLYNTTVNVAYTLDLFGGIRRQIEALAAQVDYQRYEWDATYLTLTSNIVTTSITEASLRGQIEATHSLIHEQELALNLIRKQYQLGAVSAAEILSQSTELSQTRATLPPLEKRLAQNRNALAALVGCLPEEFQIPEFRLQDLHLPDHIPLTLPSNLVRQRPDVQAAEALLHAASAQIGVATANMLPQITLSAYYGFISTQLEHFFSKANSIWSLGGQLLQPIFQGETLISERRAAIADYDKAAADYRQTVILAFQNVADALNALTIDAQTLRDYARAEKTARANWRLVRNQYRLGAVSYLNLLIAEQQYQRARISRIQAEAARFSDTAALYHALGGGWWHVEVPI